LDVYTTIGGLTTLESGKNKKIAGAAIIVMSSIILSRLTGFVRETLVPNYIGFDWHGDAYNIAFKITGLMYDLLVGGAIAAALIPILSGYIAKDNEKEGWKSISTFINAVIIAMTFVCVLGIIFAPFLVKISAWGFSDDPKQVALTIKLVRILFPSVALLMLTGLTNGVLNSYKRFTASAFGPTIYNIGCSISIFVFGRNNSEHLERIAYGIVLTSLLYFLLQLFLVFPNLKHYRFLFDLKNPEFKKLIKLAVPSLISSSIVQINVLIISSFASTIGKGVVTAYNVADRTWQLPYGIFAQGLGIAILPTISAMSALGDTKQFKFTVQKAIKVLTYAIVPCSIIFAVSGSEVISTIFQFTNKFDFSHVALTANILAFFSLAMVSQSVVAILNRSFYAQNDTKTPLYTGLSTIFVILGMCFYFTNFTSFNTPGLALSYTIASIINAILLYGLLVKKIGPLKANFKYFALKTALASIFSALVLIGANAFVFNYHVSKIIQIFRLSVVLSACFLTYFFVTLLLKQEEAIYLKDILVTKLRRNKVKS
jgi:putative peptidoglycan lipid II flippase